MKGVMFYLVLLVWLTGLAQPITAQGHYQILNKKNTFKTSFQLVNDLVIVPVEVNGVELSFLLDTGVNATLIFAIDGEIPEVKNTSRVYLRGLGSGEPVMALKAVNNSVKLGDAESSRETLYVIDEELIGLSNRLGIELNGILGYDFFRDLVVAFNYRRKFMKVYTPEVYRYKKCKSCVDLPLIFDDNKPYIKVGVAIEDPDKEKELVLLMDSGSGEVVWLFIDDEKGVNVPNKSFPDFLGYSISGSVYGERSRISSLDLGGIKLREITASFPDTTYIKNTPLFALRDGSIGSQVLKRFHLTIDYPGQNLRLKPNPNFKEPFEYNMSGLVVEHSGQRIVRNYETPPPFFAVKEINNGDSEMRERKYQIRFTLAQQFRIAEIRPGSPAEEAGLKTGDFILKINGKPANRFSLEKISELLTSRDGREIRLVIERGNQQRKFKFKLKRIL